MHRPRYIRVQTHDLLRIDAQQLIGSQRSAPEWAKASLAKTPFVVVRHGIAANREIPIGVRGRERHQRWAGLCHADLVNNTVTPPQLLRYRISAFRKDDVPAFRALEILKKRWQDIDHRWGPGGSVGFELATGSSTANPESDLDVVIHAQRRMTIMEANDLCARARDLPATVDIRVETNVCGFSLAEFARQHPAPILIRLASGVTLGRDPWAEETGVDEARHGTP